MKRPIKPKPVSKNRARISDLYNRLQQPDKRAAAILELLAHFRAPSEYMLMCKIMQRTSTEIKTRQINGERPELVFQIDMRYEDRTKQPLYGHYYQPVYVLKSWNSLSDGVILSYLQLCKQIGRLL